METPASEIDRVVAMRHDFLATLCDNPATKPELVTRLDTSRSTVDRAIGDLESYDMVQRTTDHYELTMVGKGAYDRYREYLDDLAVIERAREILAPLSPDVPFSRDLLVDAEIELAEPHDPHQPLEMAADIMADASRLRKVSPAVFPVCIDVLNGQATDELSIELVVPPDVLSAMTSRYSDDIECLETAEHELSEVTETPPYALWVADTPDGQHAGLMPYGETGVEGVILTDDEEACRWARDQFQRFRDRGTPVDSFSDRA